MNVGLDILLRRRPRSYLVGLAVCMALIYLASAFDLTFLLGTSPFWQNPSGPWLADSADQKINFDMMSSLAGYYKYAQSPWQIPVFLVPGIGPPGGTSGIFLDFIPIVALLGKMISTLMGAPVNPYGAWIAVAFTLSAVFAALIVAETSAAHFAGTALAVILVISAPPLLHRFGHLVMFGQFPILAALWLYRVDRRLSNWVRVAASWTLLLGVALLIGIYVFVLSGAVYAGSWIERRLLRPANIGARWGEPGLIAVVIACLMALAGHIGQGTSSPFSAGFGHYSMNLASPFWPQRSGVLHGFWKIVDATGGQYEGFNYFGAGGLVIIASVLLLYGKELIERTRHNLGIIGIFLILILFSLSDQIYLFNFMLIDYTFSWRVDHILGTFRSSGRFFWPVYYAALIFGTTFLLVRIPRWSVVAWVVIVGGLQLWDTEPLRGRMTSLSQRHAATEIDPKVWQPRIANAQYVFIVPSYNCSVPEGEGLNMELALLIGRANRSTNTVYNPRGATDCVAEQSVAKVGPWPDTTLYVFLRDMRNSVRNDAIPAALKCSAFAQGTWCMGHIEAP